MRKLDNKGFFLIETLIVTTVVATAMLFLYAQMTKLLDGYELRLTYNTVDGLYAAAELNDYILNDSTKYATLTGSANITVNGFVDVPCSAFTNLTYCTALYNSFGINKVIITKYNTADIKSQAPTEGTFSDDLKLFIDNISDVTDGSASDYRLIVGFTDGSFSTMKLSAGPDLSAPVITGNAVLYVISGDTYNVRDGLVATDNLYGDISSNIICTVVAGSTYNCVATDSSGNASTAFSRTVTTVPRVVTKAYTGGQQTFTSQVSGYYKIELWGAEGGTFTSSTIIGGKGAYAQGSIYLASGSSVYIYVGGNGNGTGAAGYNGGGLGGVGSTDDGSGGGGATDVRQGGTALTNRILVAAGGGGSNGYSASYGMGGYGGAAVGGDGTYTVGTYSGYGGTQSAGGLGGTSSVAGANGAIGVGGAGGNYSGTYGAGGGGGGYYGGGGGGNRRGGGGGGSSYYNPAVIIWPVIAGGDSGMPDWAGTGSMTGNGNGTTTEVDGYAKVSFMSY